ncbi:MAG TPA: TetR-like C-terminal domain-containing protein [Solirubrobacteraceae bacterium]
MPRVGLDSEAVVTAAATLADEEGLTALTLSTLAARLGVRAPSLYGHVDGLPDLRRRLATRGAGELNRAVRGAVAGQAGPDALRAMAAAYRGYAHAHPGTYEAMQRAPEGPGAHADAARELIVVFLAALAGYHLPEAEQIHAVRAVRAALHGFVALESEGGFRLPVALADSYARLVDMLDEGLHRLAEV